MKDIVQWRQSYHLPLEASVHAFKEMKSFTEAQLSEDRREASLQQRQQSFMSGDPEGRKVTSLTFICWQVTSRKYPPSLFVF